MNGIEAMQAVDKAARELVIRSFSRAAEYVQLSVADCGVGIAERDTDSRLGPLLHHQIKRPWNGTFDLPFNRGRSRRAPVSCPQAEAGCDASIHAAAA